MSPCVLNGVAVCAHTLCNTSQPPGVVWGCSSRLVSTSPGPISTSGCFYYCALPFGMTLGKVPVTVEKVPLTAEKVLLTTGKTVGLPLGAHKTGQGRKPYGSVGDVLSEWVRR